MWFYLKDTVTICFMINNVLFDLRHDAILCVFWDAEHTSDTRYFTRTLLVKIHKHVFADDVGRL